MKLKFALIAAVALSIVSSLKAVDNLPPEFEFISPSLRGRCLEELFKGIDSTNAIYAVHAAEGLTAAGQGKFVISKFEPLMQADNTLQLKCCYARELLRAGEKSYLSFLADTLKQPDSNAWAHAAEGVFKTSAQVDVSILTQALNYNTTALDKVWLNAAIAKSTGEYESLRKFLYAGNVLIASVAAYALGGMNALSGKDIEHISQLANKAGEFENVLLLSSLWSSRPSEAKAGILNSASSKTSSVRAFAAYSLQNASDAQSIAVLLKLLEDENEDVRIRAAHSLLVIRASEDKKMLRPSRLDLRISQTTVTASQKVTVAAANPEKPLRCIIATPYTAGDEERIEGFKYYENLKWCVLNPADGTNGFTIDTANWKSGVYNLSLIAKYEDAYDYRDFSITVLEERPVFKPVIEWDKSISDKREGLGSFLKLEDGKALACNYMTDDGGLTWHKSPAAFGYMVCRLRNGSIVAFSGHLKAIDKGRFSVGVNYYDSSLRQTESMKAVINLPQFVSGIAHDYYDTPLPIRSIVELKDGSLISTMYGRFAGDDTPWNWNTGDKRAAKMRMFVLQSKDNGRTWNYLATVGQDTANATMEGFNESVAGYLPDGRLMALMRSGDNAHSGWENNSMYASFSSDEGKCWTPPASAGVESVAPDFCVMRSGVIACSYGRPGVKVMFSGDNASSWGGYLSVNPERYRGYTAICEIEPNVLLVGYRVKNSYDAKTNTRIADQLRVARIRLEYLR